MPQWTAEQEKVISSDAGKLVCSAAAGSGKTAVMVERVVRMIESGKDPYSFLVITFTNAAAAEMKEKIRKRLLSVRKDPVMEVCTIHAFCQHLIRQEFQIAEVDPLFQICTTAQRESLFEDAFRKACDCLKKNGDREYLSFTEKYEPKEALEIVRTVYEFIRSLPEPFAWLEEKTEGVPLDYDRDHPWFVTVARMLEEQLVSARMILRRQAGMFDEYEKVEAFRPVFRADSDLVEAIARWIGGQDVPREELEKDFMRSPAPRGLNDREADWKERYREDREKLKKLCGEMRSLILMDREKMKTEFAGIRESLRGLRKLTEETHAFFEDNKKRFCVLDFADLEHKALKILNDGDGCRSVRSRYRYIFVDECQDISEIQDTLIQKLGGDGNMLFMVGDVKQSIYRFRLANPNLFRQRAKEAEQVLPLRSNFRSRPEILETANTIFRDVMKGDAAEVDYDPGTDDLFPGRTDTPGRIPVRVDLLEVPEDRKPLESVADHVAAEISELVREKRAELRDIMILMPEVSTDGPKLTEMLKARGIPVFFDGKGDYFSQREVELFRNLLSLLDNPRQDLPLLTVLTGPVFRFSEEELSLIRLSLTGKDVPFWKAFDRAADEDTALGARCRRVREQLGRWRYQAEHMPLDDFCWYLAGESGLYPVVGAAENGHAAQKNLRSFCLQADRARKKGICTLRDFLAHLTEQASSGEMQAAATLGEGDQLVRIMTMHKSKGLQFPVVFCLGLNRSVTGSHPAPVMLDRELGICMNYKVPAWRLSRKTAADKIFHWKDAHDRKAEKICLLYVAMTRAQERLYLVGTRTDDTLWRTGPGEHRVVSAADYQDWIMPALYDQEKESTGCAQASNPWEIRKVSEYQQQTVETGSTIHSLEAWRDDLLSAPPVDELWTVFSQEKAPPDEDGGIMKKYSVSSLLLEARNRIFAEEEEQTPEEKRTPDEVVRLMRRYQAGSRPAFLEPPPENEGARRGTVIHRFLSLVNLEEMRGEDAREERLRAMLGCLTADGVFTPEDASVIRPESVSRFYDSPLGRRLLASPDVRREWDFNLSVPERNMIVQGIIDCAFREGDGWILLDYKTDRIDDETAFLEEYRPQLEWYRKALEKLTGLPVRESWLYSLSVDKAFNLSQQA